MIITKQILKDLQEDKIRLYLEDGQRVTASSSGELNCGSFKVEWRPGIQLPIAKEEEVPSA